MKQISPDPQIRHWIWNLQFNGNLHGWNFSNWKVLNNASVCQTWQNRHGLKKSLSDPVGNHLSQVWWWKQDCSCWVHKCCCRVAEILLALLLFGLISIFMSFTFLKITCVEQQALLDLRSNPLFTPILVMEGATPLEDCVLSFSQFTGAERDSLVYLAGLLGARYFSCHSFSCS